MTLKPKLICALVANLFLAAPALAQQDFTLSGSVGVGGRVLDDNANDPSKLMQFRDLDENHILNFDLRGRGSDYYFDAFGENIATDDQSLNLRGGSYQAFKYQLFSNTLRHRFGMGPAVRTPHAGAGTDTLTAFFPGTNAALNASAITNPNTWNPFDSTIKRHDYGGSFEWSRFSPWYLRVDANRVEREGTRTISASNGESPGNGFQELPRPVDWETTNWSAEGGYQSKTMNFALNVSHSRFKNDFDVLRFSNPFLNAGVALPLQVLDSKPLEPDNELWKWSLNGNLKNLFWNSTLSGRFTYSKLTNDVSVLPFTLDNGAGTPAPLNFAAPTGANPSDFHGEIVNKTAAVAFSSHPMRGLDTRVYWHWREKDNKSTDMRFTAPLLGCPVADPCEPHKFSYETHNAGVEAGYRLAANHRLTGGLDYTHTDRTRVDFDETRDWKLFLQWKGHLTDIVDSRVKYQFLNRRSDFISGASSTEIALNPIAAFVRRFDLANVNQHQLKATLDIAPREFLDFGFEAIYKNNDYKDSQLGRTEDQRTELYASVSYGDPQQFRVLAFGDVEYSWYKSRHRVGGGNPNPDAPPEGAPFSSTYTWGAKNYDKSWQFGVGADWKPMERLMVNGSLIYARTKGTVDFSPEGAVVLAAPGLLNIGNFDNTRRWALNLKGTYAITNNWEVTAGYAYERYRYSDIGYDDFGYIARGGTTGTPASGVTNTTANSYATGEGAFQNYNANIFYLIGTYRF